MNRNGDKREVCIGDTLGLRGPNGLRSTFMATENLVLVYAQTAGDAVQLGAALTPVQAAAFDRRGGLVAMSRDERTALFVLPGATLGEQSMRAPGWN